MISQACFSDLFVRFGKKYSQPFIMTSTDDEEVTRNSKRFRTVRCRFCRRKTVNMISYPGSSMVAEELSLMPLAGLNQAFASESRRVGFIWGVLFAVAVCFFIYHLYALVKRYYEDPVSTEIEVRSTAFEFPSLYICNPLVISMSLVRMSEDANETEVKRYQKSIKRWADAFEKVKREIDKYNPTEEFKAFWFGPSERLNVSGMLSSFKALDSPLNMFASPPSQTLIHADIDGDELSLDSFKVVPSNKFYSCLKFMNGSMLKSPENKLTLYLYADASLSPKYKPRHLNDLIGVTYEGVRQSYATSSMELFFVQKNMYPDAAAHQVTAACGANTRITVVMTEVNTINRKKRPCKERARTVRLANHLKPDAPVKSILDHASCVSFEAAEKINKSCDCFPLDSPVPAGVLDPKLCVNLSHFNPKRIAKNIRCANRIYREKIETAKREYSCEMEDPCSTLMYEVSSAASRWPTEILAGKFIKNIFKETAKIRKEKNLTVYAWNNVFNERGAAQLNMLRENVAKIEIRPLESKSTRMTETLAYSIFALLSDIGGILGLYVGASLLSICEVIQTCFMVVLMYVKTMMERRMNLRIHL